MVPFLHRTGLALAEILAAIAGSGVRAQAGILVLAKSAVRVQLARPACCFRTAQVAEQTLLSLQRMWSCCCVPGQQREPEHGCPLFVCTDTGGGGPVLPGRGRALPVCRVRVAAAGAGHCSAAAQPLRGAGGVATGSAQAETVHAPVAAQPARGAAGVAVPRARLTVLCSARAPILPANLSPDEWTLCESICQLPDEQAW